MNGYQESLKLLKLKIDENTKENKTNAKISLKINTYSEGELIIEFPDGTLFEFSDGEYGTIPFSKVVENGKLILGI